MLQEFLNNVLNNMFKPLLLFFYAGFLVSVFKVKFEFPKAVYQGLTIFLLLAIGWRGGEELAELEAGDLKQALGFMLVGVVTNTIIGITAYIILRKGTRLRAIDAATVSGYYGSDSAGTFLTAAGVLKASAIDSAAYMPVMLAVMEIPGCLVALYLISKMRNSGMDEYGNMPGEPNFGRHPQALTQSGHAPAEHEAGETLHSETVHVHQEELVGAAAGGHEISRTTPRGTVARHGMRTHSLTADEVRQLQEEFGNGQGGHGGEGSPQRGLTKAEQAEADLALEHVSSDEVRPVRRKSSIFSKETLHEVFFNPGIYLLFAGIAIGFIGRKQEATGPDDKLFVELFHPVLCLFLLEMGMTAASKIKDLKAGGWQFIAFALLAPNLFAAMGIVVAHGYSMYLGEPFAIGTYVLFAVLCGAASYIAVPAVQRMAIPEASPTLPLAASLGVTFSYNVTIGIPVYILLASLITKYFPVVAASSGAS